MLVENACVELAEKSGLFFQRDETVVPAVSALRAPEITEQIINLGVNTYSQACGVLTEDEIAEIMDDLKIMSLLFDYGLEIAPRTKPNVINMDKLIAYGNQINSKLGSINIPEEKIHQIRLAAHKKILDEQLAERNTMEQNHMSAGEAAPGGGTGD